MKFNTPKVFLFKSSGYSSVLEVGFKFVGPELCLQSQFEVVNKLHNKNICSQLRFLAEYRRVCSTASVSLSYSCHFRNRFTWMSPSVRPPPEVRTALG